MRKGILAGAALFFLTVATSEAQVQFGTPTTVTPAPPQPLSNEPVPPPKMPQPFPVDPQPPLNPPQPFQTEQLPAPKTQRPTGGPVPAYGTYPDIGPYTRQQAESQGRLFFWNTQPADGSLADGRNLAWVNLDFLVWWLKPGPLPVALVTTGSANDNIPGALGQPNTSVLFGQHNLDFNTLAGANVSVGMWLPQCPALGFEAGYLGLQSSSIRYSAFSDPNGNQIIARPIVNAQTGTEQSYVDSFPGAASGGITVLANTQFDSWEINAVVNMLHAPNLNWDVIIGFRSLDLFEDLQIQDTVVPLTAGTFTFGSGPADPPNALTDFDCIRTSNHFYGGQIGSRLKWTAGLFDLTWTAKVALGATQQIIQVDGGSLLLSPNGPPAAIQGGILAQPTNIGRVYHSAFSVVPETGFNLGYQCTPWLRVQAGYSCLYWSNVVRPGNQVDRAVNPSQVPTDPSFGTLTGPARPLLYPVTSDFWAQGLNFGIELRF